MTITIRVTIDGHEHLEEVARFERGELQAGNVGLALAEAKSLLASVQRTVVDQQISAWVKKRARCESCGTDLRHKGHNTLVLRTVFGKLKVDSPRLYYCSCQERARTSFSPLSELLPERTAPELRYLETKWASCKRRRKGAHIWRREAVVATFVLAQHDDSPPSLRCPGHCAFFGAQATSRTPLSGGEQRSRILVVAEHRRIMTGTGHRESLSQRGSRASDVGKPAGMPYQCRSTVGSSAKRCPTAQETMRRFLCAACRVAVCLCTTCDRGQRYCSVGCARSARHQAHRESDRRYQSSERGRLKHAERSRRYRQRRRSD